MNSDFHIEQIWNRQLEQEATAWAARCSYSHQNGGRGENLSMHSITNDIPNLIKRMIEGWIGEKREYYPGRGFSMATGHYTQVPNAFSMGGSHLFYLLLFVFFFFICVRGVYFLGFVLYISNELYS